MMGMLGYMFPVETFLIVLGEVWAFRALVAGAVHGTIYGAIAMRAGKTVT